MCVDLALLQMPVGQERVRTRGWEEGEGKGGSEEARGKGAGEWRPHAPHTPYVPCTLHVACTPHVPCTPETHPSWGLESNSVTSCFESHARSSSE